MTKLAIKNHHQEKRLFRLRAMAILIGVGIFTAIIFTRLFYLQVIEHRFYTTLSQHNIINLIPISPKRGLIYDRNGLLIAKNIPAYSLNLIPGRIKNLRETLEALQKIITITPQQISTFKKNYSIYHRFQPMTLIPKLTEIQAAKFYVNRYRFPGVLIEPRLLRQYPLGLPLGDVVGYVGRITANELKTVKQQNYSISGYIGKTGIEKQYENELHGHVGTEEVEINAAGRIVRTLKENPATPGATMYLTIDATLQQFAEKALGHNSGAIVAIQPSTGQVLALVTKPGYDPNPFVTGISEKAYAALLNAPQHPLYNRAIRGLYSPASTIKPFYAIGGLNNGTITKHSSIFDPGWFRVPGTKHIFHDWKHSGHGVVNLTKAITVSCDTYFYNLAMTMGINKMGDILREFGFGTPTGIDLPNELSGIVPSPEWKRRTKGVPWYTGDTIVDGIGQGSVLSTPIQLAVATATLANHGMRLKPHLLLKMQLANGSEINQQVEPEPAVILSNNQNWHTVIRAMERVVTSIYGTAVAFGRHPAYSVAAKTGTAQVYGKSRDEERVRMDIPKRLRNHHLYIAFAPVHHPKIAIAIVVEHAAFADRIARKVMDFYLVKKPPNRN